jgi:hypothetical protein
MGPLRFPSHEPGWNPNGYLYNATQPMPVTISKTRLVQTAAVPAAETQPEPAGYQAACLGCHDDHMMRQQRLTRAQWDREVTKMNTWGAVVKPEQRDGPLTICQHATSPDGHSEGAGASLASPSAVVNPQYR